MKIRVQSFKCTSIDNTHDPWCGVCDWRGEVRTGRYGAARARAEVRRHVEETGHVVYIDVTRQHGYRAHPVQPGGEE